MLWRMMRWAALVFCFYDLDMCPSSWE
jgi:hypothetical protein